MPKVNVDVPLDLKQRLEEEAGRRMLSQRAVLILALEAYLTERERASERCDTMDPAAQKSTSNNATQ